MQLRIIPLNVVEEKVPAQLFPHDGDYATWVRTKNPDFPEFEANKVQLHLYFLEEDNWAFRSLTVPEPYKSKIREWLIDKDGFGDYDTVFLEVDIELLLLYTRKKVAIVRGPLDKRGPHIHLDIELDEVPLIKAWIEAGMPEPYCS